MKTKLSKDFLCKEQRHNLLKPTVYMLFYASLLIISVFCIIIFFRFVGSNYGRYETDLLDVVVVSLFIIVMAVFSVVAFITELFENILTVLFIWQIKKNNYTIRTDGQWYEVYCMDEFWIGTYRITEYEP